MDEPIDTNFSGNGRDKNTLTVDDFLNDKESSVRGSSVLPSAEPFEEKIPFDLYKRVGFQIATENKECPEEKFQLALREHLDRNKRKNELIELVSLFNIQRYQDKIAEAKVWMEKEYEELKREIPGINKLVEKRQFIERDLELKKRKLYVKLEDFFRQKGVLLKKKLDELKLESGEAGKIVRQVYIDKKDLVKQFNTDCGNIFDEKINWLKELKAKLKARYEQLQEELKSNDLRGIGPVLYSFLIALGATGALVAGWFFAVFINASDDPHFENMTISQVVSNLMNFSSGRVWWQPFLLLVAFLIIVYFLSDIMKKKYDEVKNEEKENDDETSDNDTWEWEQAGINPFSGKIKAKNWFLFWLKICPWIFVVGTMLILMSYSKEGDKFAGSLTGEAIGFLICIALSGAAYIYIANKNRKNKNIEEGRSTRLEITTLFLTFIIFNVFVALLLLFSKRFIIDLGYQQFKQFFGLVNFILVMTITSLIIGYGYYYKGIVSLSSFLNWKINKVDEQIRKKSNVDWLSKAAIGAGRKSEDIANSIVEMINKGLDELNNYFTSNSRMVTVLHLETKDTSYPYLSEPDARLFPEYDVIVRNLIFDCQDEVKKKMEIDNQIKEILDQQKQNNQSASNLIDTNHNRIHQWNNEIIEEKIELIERLAKEDNRFLWEQVQLKDGYHLGMIYRKHNGAKMEDYFQPCATGNLMTEPMNI